MENSQDMKVRTRSYESKLSIVIPIYNEGNHIRNSIQTIEEVLINHNIHYEMILVDDGSNDNTWIILDEMARDNPRITAIRLSKNFGKEPALCAGIDYSDGDMVLIMDCDLQHPPPLIPDMISAWVEEGFDVVEGVKSSRGKEKIINYISAKAFYYLLKKTANIDLNNASDFKLMDRAVVNAWKEMGEKAIFFRGMSAWTGFNRKQVEFKVEERAGGQSKWSSLHLIKLAVNAITSYTSLPLHLVTVLGLIILFITMVLGVQTLYMKLSNRAMDGFTTVILLQLLIGSSIMISLGIIGIYLSKIYKEVKARPRYLIAKCIRGGDRQC